MPLELKKQLLNSSEKNSKFRVTVRSITIPWAYRPTQYSAKGTGR